MEVNPKHNPDIADNRVFRRAVDSDDLQMMLEAVKGQIVNCSILIKHPYGGLDVTPLRLIKQRERWQKLLDKYTLTQ